MAAAERLTRKAHVSVHRKDYEFTSNSGLAEHPQRFHAVQQRHGDIEHNDLRIQLPGERDQLPSIGGNSNHVIVSREQLAERLGKNAVIVGD
jgi:hypothetical protein